jgi:nucleotide-binding universal stress UspA family protein
LLRLLGDMGGENDMLEKVLLPTDGSETAEKAIAFAARLFENTPCKVTLLSVVEEPVYSAFWSDGLIAPEVLMPPPEELREELDKRAEEMLSESAKPLRDAGLDVQPKIRFGNSAAEVLQEAEEGDYDMIVMGSHGRGALGGFLLGSVSNRVAHHAKCPVLIVRQ